ILHSPCRPAISLVAASLRTGGHGGPRPVDGTPSRPGGWVEGREEGAGGGGGGWVDAQGPPNEPHAPGGVALCHTPAIATPPPPGLGREEATRRIKSGLTAARTNYSALLTIHEETWSGDRLAFNLSALGQSAVGFIDVADDHVRLEVALPWLLAVLAQKFTPAIRKEGTLMLEKPRKAFRLPLVTRGVGLPSNLLTSPSIGEWPSRLCHAHDAVCLDDVRCFIPVHERRAC